MQSQYIHEARIQSDIRKEHLMTATLNGRRIAFLATDGVEQVELTEPWEALKNAGAKVELVSPKSDEIQGMNHIDKGDKFRVDQSVAQARAEDYDGLVLPGGVVNPDNLRLDKQAVSFVKAFFDQQKPVGAICHGPWTMVEADVVRGRTLTSFPSVQTDIRNAGGTWVDEEVHVDSGLVTSRKPDDLKSFCSKLVEEFAEGKHSNQTA